MDITSFRTQVERDTAQHGGYLRCETCGLTVEVDAAYWRTGWPTCHGYTMRWWTRRQIDAGEVPEVARR